MKMTEVVLTAEDFLRRYAGEECRQSPPDRQIAIITWNGEEVWLEVLNRVVRNNRTGIAATVVLLPHRREATAFCEQPPYVRDETELLTLPDVLPGFSVPVRRFFE